MHLAKTGLNVLRPNKMLGRTGQEEVRARYVDAPSSYPADGLHRFLCAHPEQAATILSSLFGKLGANDSKGVAE